MTRKKPTQTQMITSRMIRMMIQTGNFFFARGIADGTGTESAGAGTTGIGPAGIWPE